MAELLDSLPAAPVLRTFVEYLFAFCSRLEAASDVISGIYMRLTIPDKCVQFRDPHLNSPGEILPKAIEGSIFRRFSNLDKCRPETPGDIISGVAVY